MRKRGIIGHSVLSQFLLQFSTKSSLLQSQTLNFVSGNIWPSVERSNGLSDFFNFFLPLPRLSLFASFVKQERLWQKIYGKSWSSTFAKEPLAKKNQNKGKNKITRPFSLLCSSQSPCWWVGVRRICNILRRRPIHN